MVDGWRWRQKQARQRDAWLLANIVQPHTKRRMKASDFMVDDRVKDPGKLWQRIVERKKKDGAWH